MLVPPCGYKGGKRVLAKLIIPHLLQTKADHYFDLCCGSGAITLALVSAGIKPQQITMVEAGPWGMFWKKIADGSFSVEKVEKLLSERPNPKLVKDWVEEMVCKMPVSAETFLIIQAAAYGSTPAWWDGTKWRGDPSANRSYHARPYWQPGPTSKEKKPRGTIFCPDKILSRLTEIKNRCKNLNVFHGKVEDADLKKTKAAYYLDPPYQGTTGYAFELDVEKFIANGPRPLFVSEGRQLLGANPVMCFNKIRGGNVTSGSKNKAKRRQEFLNCFQ